MTPWLRLLARLRQLEARHWSAMAASVVLHLAVLLGLRQAPPPPPEQISFEIALKAPEAEPIKRPRAKADKPADKRTRLAKAKKPKRKAEPRQPHTLEAAFKPEKRRRKDVPAVSLPKAETQAAQAGEEPRPQTPSTRQALAAAKPMEAAATAPAGAVQTPPQGSEPAGASQPAATPSEQSGAAGIALAAARTLAASTGGAPQGAEQSLSAGAVAPGAEAGSGAAGFSASMGAGSGLNLAAGRGANASSASESTPLPGGEPQGLRLTASGSLSSLPEFAQGQGGLASGQLAQDAGVASAADGQGQGRALASSLAGGVSATPPSGPAGVPGQGGAGAAGSRPGATGQASTPAPAAGRLAASGGTGKAQAVAAPRRAAGSSQAAKALALAPGEPGSGPQWAVVLQPVQAQPTAAPGEARRGGGGGKVGEQAAGPIAGGDAADAGTPPGPARLARSGSGQLAALRPGAEARGGGTAGGQGVTPALGRSAPSGGAPAGRAQAMSGIKPSEQKVMRPDSRAETLDVLAPSTYCPVPLPGHAQPDNRAPAAGADRLELPGYAANNPSFVYPFLANLRGVQGRLIVRVQVLPDGRPGDMLLKQGSGSEMLDKDAREQLARWRFTPARKNGQAVSAWIDVPVVYRLPNDRK